MCNGQGGGEPERSVPVLAARINELRYNDTPILGKIDLEVHPRETVALIGPSGIGKSSLLRIIAGLEHGYRGSCHIHGKVSVVFQEPVLLPWRNLRDNITITAQVGPDEAEDALKKVGLDGRSADFPSQLSLGQQRRVSLARAFANRPDLLLMDEPYVSLDPELTEEMMALFLKLRAEQTVTTILVTHVEDEARKLADRIVTLGGAPASIVSDIRNSGALPDLPEH